MAGLIRSTGRGGSPSADGAEPLCSTGGVGPSGLGWGRRNALRCLLLVLALSMVTTGDGVAPATFGPRIAAALRPPMGWDSWNTFGCDIDEAKILAAARMLVSSGMRSAGYAYVIVDDCWQAPDRAPDGTLVADPVRFPRGMAALAAQIHDLGLKFGIYQSPRAKTCAEYVGTLPGATGAATHEEQDARVFAAWGVDYLKYDWCSPEGSVAEQASAFAAMDQALRATGRPVVYSINPNSLHASTGPLYDWGQVADMWRTTQDITGSWHTGCPAACSTGGALGVIDILDVQAGLWRAAGPGHWNDPDMLEVGVHGTFTVTENRAHLAMWAMMAAPLIAGNDLTAMPPEVRGVLTDPDVIALDQDPVGRQARRVRGNGRTEIWTRPLADGSVAVALLNRSATTAVISTSAVEVQAPPAEEYAVFDLWSKTATTTPGVLVASVPPHGVALYRLHPAP